ncbi:MAG: c-type cytochrome [Adhaeribacter sp.]
MKKTILLLAAANLLWLGACETKKQAGEEYYDPNYKPGTAQTAPATTAPAAGSADAEVPETTPPPAGDAPVAVPDKATGEPAKASEAEVAVVPKDKLKPSPAGADFTKGKNLIAKSDCLACHKDDAKLVGPAYIDVANKYEATDANIAKLADKIVKGGAGAWGQIPMSPHPSLAQADAKEMVKYILSLKK